MANQTAVLIVTRSPHAARIYASHHAIRGVWPESAEHAQMSPKAGMILLPDWALHPDGRRLADLYATRLRR